MEKWLNTYLLFAAQRTPCINIYKVLIIPYISSSFPLQLPIYSHDFLLRVTFPMKHALWKCEV